MHQITNILSTLRRDKRAVTALEYGMVAGLVAGALVITFTGLATRIGAVINAIIF